MKVIHILTTSPSSAVKDKDWQIYNGWHVKTVKHLMKETKDYEFECWCPEKTLKEELGVTRDGIRFRAFPAVEGRIGWEVSLPMMKALKKEKNAIVHIHGLHYLIAYAAIREAKKNNNPVVVQHHGESPRFKFASGTPREHYERFILPKVDHVFAISLAERAYLERWIDKKKVTLQGMGVEDNFYVGDRVAARVRLGIPEDAVVMLYVGRLFTLKGVQHILSAFDALKLDPEDNKEYVLLMVGGEPTHELYAAAKASGAKVVEFSKDLNLADYYRAADMSFLLQSKMVCNWLGYGIASAESLACGTPVIASSYAAISKDPLKFAMKYGAYWDETMPVSKLVDAINHVHSTDYNQADFNELLSEWFDWKKISKNTLRVYKQVTNSQVKRK